MIPLRRASTGLGGHKVVGSAAVGVATAFLLLIAVAALVSACEEGNQPVAGEQLDRSTIGTEAPSQATYLVPIEGAGIEAGSRRVIPVFDIPGGLPRVLVDIDPVDGSRTPFPLYAETTFGQPQTLRVLKGLPGDEWLVVQSPVRPHGSQVWVRSSDFEHFETDIRIEVKLSEPAELVVYDGNRVRLTTTIAHGRSSRPTTVADTYIREVLDGSNVSPAFGSYVLSLGILSETVGRHGGGLAVQAISGGAHPDDLGRAISSGGIRVSDSSIERMVAEVDLLGAPVIITEPNGQARPQPRPQLIAATMALDPIAPPPSPAISYS